MRNWYFKYMLSNNPDVVSERGVRIRRRINPLLRKAGKLMGAYKFQIERKAIVPKDKRIIFVPTHGFKDDVLYTSLMIDRHAYILFGNLPEFFNSINGVNAWLNGSILVNRLDKENRKSSMKKMEKVIEYGSDIMLFSEGRWNHSENVLILKLFPGVYDLAKNTGALVMPVATHLEGDNCYGILDEAFDITKFDRKEGVALLRDKMATLKWELMKKYSNYRREDIDHGQDLKQEWQDYIQSLINQTKYFDPVLEEQAYYRDKNEKTYEEVMPISIVHCPDVVKKLTLK